MATIFTSTDAQVLMPREIADGMIKRTRTESVIARLSNREPMRFGKKDYLVFNDFPKAEFVEEGAQKSPTKGGFSSVTAVPHKAQVTMRFSEEAIWTDEDYQLEIINSLASEGSVALSRALDLGMIHRVNPLTGAEISSWDNYVAKTTKSVTLAQAGADPDDDFASAVGLLVNQPESWGVSGAAFDPKFSWTLSQLKNTGMITVARGTGGAEIAKDLKDISLLDVYSAVECLGKSGQLFSFHDKPNPDCPIGKNIHNVLDDRLAAIQAAMEAELAQTSLDEVVAATEKEIKEQSVS